MGEDAGMSSNRSLPELLAALETTSAEGVEVVRATYPGPLPYVARRGQYASAIDVAISDAEHATLSAELERLRRAKPKNEGR